MTTQLEMIGSKAISGRCEVSLQEREGQITNWVQMAALVVLTADLEIETDLILIKNNLTQF